MISYKEVLKGASAGFMQDIVTQIPEENGAREAFERLLDVLATHVSKENEDKLRKLAALENGGVDDWEWYGDCMEEAGLFDEDEDEDEDD